MQIGGHAGFGRRIGDVDFGPHASENPYIDVILDWYDYLFKGIHNQFATDKPVKLFVMGVNEYRQEDDWPPPEARYVKYFLHSGGRANSLRGNGLFRPPHRSRNLRTLSSMILEILFLPSADRFAAPKSL